MIKAFLFLALYLLIGRSHCLSFLLSLGWLTCSPFQEEANEILDIFLIERVSVSLRFNSIRSNEAACKSDAFVNN